MEDESCCYVHRRYWIWKGKREQEENESDDDFLDDSSEDDGAADWKRELKAITGYDPTT